MFDDVTSQVGKQSFTVSLPNATKTADDDYAGVAQVLELSQADKGITFYGKDNYTDGTNGYHWMQLLVDEEVIWETDVAGGDDQWRQVSLDLTRLEQDHILTAWEVVIGSAPQTTPTRSNGVRNSCSFTFVENMLASCRRRGNGRR